MPQVLSWISLMCRWLSCGSEMLLHVAMTTQLSIWWFFDRPDLSPRRICPSDAMFLLFARILTSDWDVMIRRPRGSVSVMQCSVFLRGSWLLIGPSWFSDVMVRLVSQRSSSSDWVVQYSDAMVRLVPQRSFFRLSRPVFRVPLRVLFQTTTVPFWLLRTLPGGVNLLRTMRFVECVRCR